MQISKDRKGGHPRVQTVNKEPSMTKQSFKDECDINHIINRYDNTGLVAHLNQAQAKYGDVTQVTDYHDAMNIVAAAQQQFMMLNPKIRDHFNNDPAEFLDAANDPDKREELVELGLIPAGADISIPADGGSASDARGSHSPTGGASSDPAPGGAGSEGSASGEV